MISSLLIFLSGLAFTIYLSNNRKGLIVNIFYYVVANCYFLLILFMLPSGFADDQYEYFLFMQYDLDVIAFKYKVMKIASFIPFELLIFDFINLRYMFFVNYVVVLLFFLKKLNLDSLSLIFLLIMPSIFLHAGLFLREPIVYIFITIFIYAILKKRFLVSIIAFLFIVVIRPDSSALLTPFFIYLYFSKPKTQFFLAIILVSFYTVLITSSQIETLLNGYRNLYGVEDFNISISSISQSLLNLLFGSRNFDIPTLIIVFETAIAGAMVYKIENRSIIVTCWLIGVLLIGSISFNSGFIVRTRSPLIIVTFIYYFYQKASKKLSES